MVTFSELGKLGRFGNCLFQIAATISYASKHNLYYEFPAWQYSSYFNGIININPSLVVQESWRWSEPSFKYQEIPYKERIDLYGYYQSEKYFKNIEDKIRGIFQMRDQIVSPIKNFITETCQGKIPVSVHVRRGDYVTDMTHYYHSLDMDWYKKAMSHFDPNTHHFFITSDDIPWCVNNFPKDISLTFSNFNEVGDFCLMRYCKHNIIANSSFSFWGSYLNENPDKIIIAPTKDKWFKPAAGHNVDDLYLPNWKLI